MKNRDTHQLLKNLRMLRRIKGLSQEQMAKQLGITQSSYARFENEGVKIDFLLVEKIAVIFELDVCYIINYHKSNDSIESEALTTVKYYTEDELIDKIAQFQERSNYLEKLNQHLQMSIRDKDEIISLLRK
jgi:transcriptional regulator with XRE-family HTH domain